MNLPHQRSDVVRPIAFLCAALPVWLMLFASAAQAQTSTINDTGFQPDRDYFSPTPFEHFDTLNGNIILTFTDLELPGNAGRSLRLHRTYNDGAWSFGIAGVPMSVLEREYPTAAVPDTIATSVTHAPVLLNVSGAKKKTYFADAPDFLQQSSMRWVVTADFWVYDRVDRRLYLPDGRTGLYDSSHRLVQITDEFGNAINLDRVGATLTITQFLGVDQRVITIELDAAGQLPVTMTYSGRQWVYSYQLPGKLQVATPPVGPGWQFGYVGVDLTTVTTRGGAAIQYVYNDVNLFYGPDPQDFVQRHVLTDRVVTDPRGQGGQWHLDYTVNSSSGITGATVTLPSGTQVKHQYISGFPDSNLIGGIRRERKEVRAPTGETEVEVVNYTKLAVVRHASNGTVWKTSAPSQRVITTGSRTFTTTYTYDDEEDNYAQFHLPIMISENGDATRTTLRTYWHSTGSPYILGRISQERVTSGGLWPGNDPWTRAWSYNAANGFMESWTEFAKGSSPVGIQTVYAPDPNGNVASISVGSAAPTTFTYQYAQVAEIRTPLYTVTRSVNPDGTIGSETQAGRTVTYSYDPMMRVVNVAPPGGTNATTVEYDNVADGWVRTTRGDSSITTTLDGFGRATRAVDANGVTTQTVYDAEGRVTFEGYPFSAGSTEVGTHYQYDAFGRLVLRTNPDTTYASWTYNTSTGSVTIRDENNRNTVQSWKAFGHPNDARLTRIVDADQKQWDYTYDTLGHLTRIDLPGGLSRTWTFNVQGLLATETQPETGTTTYGAYDAAGNLTQRTDANGTVFTYVVDENRRLSRITTSSDVTEIRYESGSDNQQSTANGTTATTFLYDTAGRLAQRQDAVDGKLFNTQFEYNANDNLRAIVYPSGRRVEYQHGPQGRLASVSEPLAGRDYAFGFTYAPSGVLSGYTTGNLIQTQIARSESRRWVESITAGPMQFTYGSYDGVGNVGAIGDSRPGFAQAFTYDATDRLQTATGAYGSAAFAYDAHGNRQSANGSTYTYQSGTLRLSNFNGTPYTYDNNGNTLTAGGVIYTYTKHNMLATAAVAGGTAAYGYDADDLRIKKAFAGTTTYYLRGLGGEVLSEWKAPGTAAGSIRDYIYAGSRLISAVEKPTSTDPNSQCGIIVPGGPPVIVTAASNQDPCFTFRGTAGRSVSAIITAASPTTFSASWYANLRKPDGTLLGTTGSTCCGYSRIFLDGREIPADGNYKLTIDPSGTASGTVSVALYEFTDITGAISLTGAPVTLPLLTPGQNARLTFAGVAGQLLSSSLTAVAPAAFVGSFYFEIRKPDGGFVASGSSCCGYSLGFLDTLPLPALPASGTYTLVVNPDDIATGTVAARLYNVTHLTGTITSDGTPATVQVTTPGQNGYLTFEGIAGQRITATMTAVSPTAFPSTWGYLHIQNPSNTSIASSIACCGSTSVFLDTIELPAAGTYRAMVDPSSTWTGTVTVRVTTITDVTGSVTIGGGAVPVTITTAGQRALITFSGTAGQQATVRITNSKTGYTTVTLKKPDGSTATSSATSGSNFNLATQTLVEGQYTIIVDPSGTGTGTLNVAVTSP
ncbi:MAG: hypothetical protein ACRD3G_20485 [Vicinamibacterales bacterium]